MFNQICSQFFLKNKMRTKYYQNFLSKKKYEKLDLVHNPNMCSALLQKKIKDKCIIINSQKVDMLNDIFLIYFDTTLIITNKSNFHPIQQLFKQNDISLIHYIQKNSYSAINEQIDKSIQLEKVFYNETKIELFLYRLMRYLNQDEKHEYETVFGYLLQKSYNESRIDRVEKYRELFQPNVKITKMQMNDFINLYELGSGSGGHVYLAYNHKEEKIYAMKMHNDGDKGNDKLRKREIHNYEIFQHPFLPRFYGSPDNKSVVIDYIDGLTLKEIKEIHLDLFEKIIIIMEILFTIQYFHMKKYIYRDLKPVNVIIDHYKNGIIIDFDRIIEDSGNKREDRTLTFLGNYIAPEIIQEGKPFSTKADIYSIGKLIYYIIKEEEATETSRLMLEPDFFEIQEIIDESTKEDPGERPEISEIILKIIKYFINNINKYRMNDFLMRKFLKIIEDNNSSNKFSNELDIIYSSNSNMSNIFNNFKQCFINHDITLRNQYLHEILYKFKFSYYDELAEQEQEEKLLQLQDELKIIVIDECDFNKMKYSIFCFNYNLIIIKRSGKNEDYFINNFIMKHIESEVFFLKELDHKSLCEIQAFSNHFRINNDEFSIFWNIISKCLILFLLKKSYNQIQIRRYDKHYRKIINNDIPEGSFFIIREEISEEINGASLIYYIPTEEIMILKRVKDTSEEAEGEINERMKYKDINIPHMNRYYGYIEKDDMKYYLIEYIEGTTLDKYDKKKLTTNEKCNIILKMMIATRYLESEGIIYKYLYLNNIIIDKEKEPILKNYEIIPKLHNKEYLNSAQKYVSFLTYLIIYLSYDNHEHIQDIKKNEKVSINELIKIFYRNILLRTCDKESFESNVIQKDEVGTEYCKFFNSLGYISRHNILKPKNICKAIHFYSLAANENYSRAQFNLGIIYYNGDEIPRDMSKAIHYLTLAANQNNSKAQLILGIIYYNGDEISRDMNKAIHYLTLAANQNEPKAQFNLGYIYYNGDEIPRDMNKAIHYLTLAANQNEPKAQFNLGYIYDKGDGIPRDMNKGIHYYLLAANQNNLDAQFNLGYIYEKGYGVSRNMNKAIHYYSLVANQNDSKAQFVLGIIYSNGDKIPRDINKAIYYFSLAANQNHSDAQFNLGAIYFNGDWIQRDMNKAIHYYGLAANQNHINAQLSLGNIYRFGNGISADINKSIYYYSLAANQNNSDAQCNLGIIYSEGEGIPRDMNKAIHYFSLAANNSNSKAQFNLGLVYSEGDGVPCDMNKSIHFYSLAANQNLFEAQFNLGCIYYKGEGVLPDINKAIYYFSLAANQNFSSANYNLGIIYFNGDKVPRDINKAIHYFSLAAEQNYSAAQSSLGIIYFNGDGVTCDINKAIHYFSLAAEQNNSVAQYNLGIIYFNGDKVPRDVDKAIHYFSLAAKQNYSAAQYNLGIIYFKGDKVPRDVDKGIHYFSLAASHNQPMAQFNLGYIYYCGLFVLRNIDKAIYYLSLAAKQYQSDAQFYLGSIYYEGLYVTHDIEKAIQYFKEASCFNHPRAKNNLGIIYKTGKGVPMNPHASIEYFEEAIRQKGDEVAMFNLAHLHFYEEINKTDLAKAIELLVKSAIKKNKLSVDLLILAVMKKYEKLNNSILEQEFEEIDKEKGHLIANLIIKEIQYRKIKDPNFYKNAFDRLKFINLVYYGDKVENQREKKKIEIIDKRPKLNKCFYEGLEEINN